MPDWSWIQPISEWIELAPGWVKFVAGGIVVYFLNNHHAPYWKERRKREAQSESHADFIRIAEEIKSDIGMLREEITSVRKQGRDAVVSFFEKSDVFLHEFLESVRPVRGKEGQDFLDNYLRTLEKHIADLRLAQMKLFVYFHEEKDIVEAANAVMLSARELSTALRRKAVESSSMRRTFKNIGTAIPENLRTTITPENVRTAMAASMIKKEKELDAEIDASHKKFSLAVAEFTGKTSGFFEQIHLKSGDRF